MSNNFNLQLDADEEILWEGKPATNLHFGIETVATGIFGTIVIGAFAGTGWFMDMFWQMLGLGALIAAAIMLFFPIYQMLMLQNTSYTLTSKRAFINNPMNRSRIIADDEGWKLDNPDKISLKVGPPDTVVFGTRPNLKYHGTLHYSPGFDVGFERITDGKKVFDLMLATAQKNNEE